MLPKTGKVLPKDDGKGPSKLTYAAAVAARCAASSATAIARSRS